MRDKFTPHHTACRGGAESFLRRIPPINVSWLVQFRASKVKYRTAFRSFRCWPNENQSPAANGRWRYAQVGNAQFERAARQVRLDKTPCLASLTPNRREMIGSAKSAK